MSQIIQTGNSNVLGSLESQKMIIQSTQAITTIILIGASILKFVFLAALFVLAFVLWLWTISFQTGRLYAQWVFTEKPDPWQAAYKLGEIFLFPLVLLTAWSRKKVQEIWKIELPLISESEPPQKCTELSLFKTLAGNQE